MNYVHIVGSETPFTEDKTVMINVDQIQRIVECSTGKDLWKVILVSAEIYVTDHELLKIDAKLDPPNRDDE